MSALEKLRAALLPLGVPVYPDTAPFAPDRLPDSYIVTALVTQRPDVFAGDTDEHGSCQVRASWYCRQGNTGHGAAMRRACREAGFGVLGCENGYDPETKHYIIFQEFFDESEDD